LPSPILDYKLATRMRGMSLYNLLRFGPRRIALFLRHLPNFVKLFWRLVRDPRVPLWPKLLLVFLLAYLLVPTDLLPDFVAGLGQIDDIVVIFLGLKAFLRFCPREVVREHVQAIAAGH